MFLPEEETFKYDCAIEGIIRSKFFYFLQKLKMLRMNDGDLSPLEKKEYYRVNVTSATSTPNYTEDGKRKAEIDMQLPENLISLSNQGRITDVKMAVMKMNLPLSEVPTTYANITNILKFTEEIDGQPYDTYTVVTDLQIGIIPGEIINNEIYLGGDIGLTNRAEQQIEDSRRFFKKFPLESDPSYGELMAPAEVSFPLLDQLSLPESQLPVHVSKLMETRKIYFDNINQFLRTISVPLKNRYAQAVKTGTIPNQARETCIWFDVNQDNTISLHFIPSGISSGFPSGDHFLSTIFSVLTNPTLKFFPVLNESHSPDTTVGIWKNQPFMIAVNERLKNMLPTLPWIKIQNTKEVIFCDNYGTSAIHPLTDNKHRGIFFGSTWWGKSIYVLDSSQATLTISSTRKIVSVFDEQHPAHSNYIELPELVYTFPCSDAVSISFVSSFILTMNGVTFNQEVLPVNYKSKVGLTNGSTLTGTIPIIENYVPLSTKPSDLKTNMILSRVDFSNAAPISVSASVLKERNIKFKFFYITDEGDMEEMIIPDDTAATFQICFEITYF